MLNSVHLNFSAQVCRNINQIKFCMDTGRTVILLNLEHLYESLYDVLNQVMNSVIWSDKTGLITYFKALVLNIQCVGTH